MKEQKLTKREQDANLFLAGRREALGFVDYPDYLIKDVFIFYKKCADEDCGHSPTSHWYTAMLAASAYFHGKDSTIKRIGTEEELSTSK